MQHPFKLKRWLERQVSEIKQVTNGAITHWFVTLQLPIGASYWACAVDIRILPDDDYFAEKMSEVLLSCKQRQKIW